MYFEFASSELTTSKYVVIRSKKKTTLILSRYFRYVVILNAVPVVVYLNTLKFPEEFLSNWNAWNAAQEFLTSLEKS